MKTLLTILLLYFSVCAMAQQGSLSQTVYRSKVAVADTTAAISAQSSPRSNGFADFWYIQSIGWRAYVNSVLTNPFKTANNGLTGTFNNYQLGGTLIKNTTINGGAAYNLSMINMNNITMSASGTYQFSRTGNTFINVDDNVLIQQVGTGTFLISNGSPSGFTIQNLSGDFYIKSLSSDIGVSRMTYDTLYDLSSASDSVVVHKGYVDSQIASAGGAYMPLEGTPTLTNDLGIDADGNYFRITNSTDTEISLPGGTSYFVQDENSTNLVTDQYMEINTSDQLEITGSLGISFFGPQTSNDASPSQITANQNNYAPATAGWYRLSSDASRDITGWVAPVADGDLLEIYNVGSFDINFTHEDTDSDAANRFLINGGGTLTVSPNECAIFRYDATTQRWRLKSYTG